LSIFIRIINAATNINETNDTNETKNNYRKIKINDKNQTEKNKIKQNKIKQNKSTLLMNKHSLMTRELLLRKIGY